MGLFWSKSRELLDLIPRQFKTDYWIFVVKRRPWLKKLFLATFLFFLLLGATAFSGYWYMFKYDGCVLNVGCLVDDKGQPLDLEKLARADFKKASYLYANKGEEIGKYFEEIRDPVRLDEVPKVLQDAFIAAEDKRFYQHSGIDIVAIASASVGNFTHAFGWKFWTRSGGASTITQQLSRLVFADEVTDFKVRTRTLNRKLREARLAIRVEKRYSKEEVLESFLNFIWLGHGANGVASGAIRYWGKDIRRERLTVREAVILASMNKNPALYDPIFHKPLEPKIDKETLPDTAVKLQQEYGEKLTKEVVRLVIAKDRYNFVLDQMKDGGSISQKEYEENLFQKDKNPDSEELAQLKSWKTPTYGYGNRMVKELLLSEGRTDKELSYYGGLRIYTTIDTKIQKIASEEFEKHLAFVNQEKGPKDKVEGAFIVIDIKTGDILALSGGSDFNETQYNRVMALRSPGSGFKPFTYATAIEYFGYDFFSKICNCPLNLSGGKPGKRWIPQNFREDNPAPLGYRNLSEMLIRSINLATLNLARSIGIESVVELANKMGVWGNPGIVRDSDGEVWFRRPGYQISSGLDPLLPTAIGSSGVNVLELANAYAVFFRNGIYMRPKLIKEIKSTYGDEIFKAEPAIEKRVLSERTATKMTALMRAVTKIGTAKISMRNINQQVACKTGTSDGPRDVSIWCGTPDLVIAFRFGIDNYSVIDLPEYMRKVSKVENMQVTGGWVAGPLARKVIDRIYLETERKKIEFSPEVESELKVLLTNPQ